MTAVAIAVPAGSAFAVADLRPWDRGTTSDSGGSARANQPAATVPVAYKDLRQTTKFSGRIGYGPTTNVDVAVQGIVTWTPAIGTVLHPGDVVLKVDESPVFLMAGTVPAWRPLDATATPGSDVAQLKQNLAALGYDPHRTLSSDNHWTAATTAAVKRWQKATGLPQTGAVTLGQVVFLPTAARVASVDLPVGAAVSPGAELLKVSGTVPLATVDLDADKQSLVTKGTSVQVTLPDGTQTEAVVDSIGPVASDSPSGQKDKQGQPNQGPTVPVTLRFTDPAKARTDGASVTMVVVTAEARQVLAVPVTALLALAEGGYGVQVRGSDGTLRLVTVTTGMFADALVQVTGELQVGDQVVVPS